MADILSHSEPTHTRQRAALEALLVAMITSTMMPTSRKTQVLDCLKDFPEIDEAKFIHDGLKAFDDFMRLDSSGLQTDGHPQNKALSDSIKDYKKQYLARRHDESKAPHPDIKAELKSHEKAYEDDFRKNQGKWAFLHASREACKALGDGHSQVWDTYFYTGMRDVLMPKPQTTNPKAHGEGSPNQKPCKMPEMNFEDGTLTLELPSFNPVDTTPEDMHKYIDSVWEALETHCKGDFKSVMIDLRAPNGGDATPMLAALAPLLDGGVLYKHIEADGTAQGTPHERTLEDGLAHSNQKKQNLSAAFPDFKENDHPLKGIPLAVLIGPNTVSAKELTALALRALSNVKLFGQKTGGQTSGPMNIVEQNVKLKKTLDDAGLGGTQILVTQNIVLDRDSSPWNKGFIEPDVTLAAGEVDAAKKWLASAGKKFTLPADAGEQIGLSRKKYAKKTNHLGWPSMRAAAASTLSASSLNKPPSSGLVSGFIASSEGLAAVVTKLMQRHGRSTQTAPKERHFPEP